MKLRKKKDEKEEVKLNEKEDFNVNIVDDVFMNQLEEDLLSERTLNNDYQDFIDERKEMLPYDKKKREQIEKLIKFEILQLFKRKKKEVESGDLEKGWFKYADYFAIPAIANHFNIYAINGDRNMGKSVSSTEEIEKIVEEKKEKFMVIRNIDDEVEAQVASDLQVGGWLNKLNYEHGSGKAKAPNIYKITKDFNPKTRKIKFNKELVGWYRPLNTSAKTKSINFPNTGIVVYEEFNEVAISNKFLKFVKFASTMIRHKPNVKILMQANYVDQSDEMLQALGLGAKKLTARDFVHFNWEMGAIIINIPKGIYRTATNKMKDTAYRASLGKYDVWKSQFGGGFSNEEPVNIINEKNISAVTPVFNIYHKNVISKTNAGKKYGAYKITLYDVYDDEGERHNVITKTIGENNSPIFVLDHLNKIMYPDAMLLEYENLEYLIEQWNKNNLKTTSYEVHGLIVSMFATASKMLDKEKDNITEIEEI